MEHDQPAFPQHGWSKDPEILARMEKNKGLTLRAYIATKAIQGILAGESEETGVYLNTYKTKEGQLTTAKFDCSDRTKENELVCTREEGIAQQAVAIADALIAELNK